MPATATATITPTPSSTPTVTLTPSVTFTPIAGQTLNAVAYQINPAHTGATTSSTLVPPLKRLWSVDLGGPVSYPLIAQGKVFVTVSNQPTQISLNYGSQLYALDDATGQVVWGPIAISGNHYWSAASYDDGNLYVISRDGLLSSYKADTGALRWSIKMPIQYAFATPPVAVQGIVFLGGAGSAGTLYAVDSRSGAVLWTAEIADGSGSSPALSNDGVFVSCTCANTYKFDRSTGQRLWLYLGRCEGGGGLTTVYFRGRLYARDPASTPNGYIFDAQRGSILGRFSADHIPAFAGSMGYFLNSGRLSAMDLLSRSTAWTFSGDGTLSSAPIVVNRQVYVGGTSGALYALDSSSGQVLWSANVGASIPKPNELTLNVLTGLNAGDGLLVVPAGNLLVAYAGIPATRTATPSPIP